MIKKINVIALKPGLLLAEPVYNKFNVKILDNGVVLTKKHIEILMRWKIESVQIEIPSETDEAAQQKQSKIISFAQVKSPKNLTTDTITTNFLGETIRAEKNIVIRGSVKNSRLHIMGDIVITGNVEGSEITSQAGGIQIEGSAVNTILNARTVAMVNTGLNIKGFSGELFFVKDRIENIKVSGSTSVIMLNDGIINGEIKSKIILAKNLGGKYGKLKMIFETPDFEQFAKIIYRHRLYIKDVRNKFYNKLKTLQASIEIVKTLGDRIRQLDDKRKEALVSRTKEFLRTKEIVEYFDKFTQLLDKQLSEQERIFIKVNGNMLGNIIIHIGNRELDVHDIYKNIEVQYKGLIRIITL